jgi:predicted metal-binding membrane protein
VTLLVAGYLGVWAGFGILVHAADLGVHRAVDASPWLRGRPWLVGAAVFALAGIYQFSPLKYRCLQQCRSPYSFIVGHWRGSDEGRHALELGARHGVFCLGCCWSLMLLMFAVGVGNLAWMLALGVVMAVEKNVRWGRRLTVPVGGGLMAGSVAIVLTATSLVG